MLIHDLLLRAERLWPDRTAVIDGTVQRNYADTATRVRQLAGSCCDPRSQLPPLHGELLRLLNGGAGGRAAERAPVRRGA